MWQYHINFTHQTHTDIQQRERTSYMKCIVIICVSSSSKRIKSKFIIFEIVTKKRNVSRKCKGVVIQEQTATYTYFDRDAGYLFIIFFVCCTYNSSCDVWCFDAIRRWCLKIIISSICVALVCCLLFFYCNLFFSSLYCLFVYLLVWI